MLSVAAVASPGIVRHLKSGLTESARGPVDVLSAILVDSYRYFGANLVPYLARYSAAEAFPEPS